MVGGLTRSHLYVSIARGDGYVIDSIAVNLSDSRASASGCFVSVRNTMDETGSILTTSMGSTREAYEMVQIDGVWTIATHRALGAC